jgi:hypothetical protein
MGFAKGNRARSQEEVEHIRRLAKEHTPGGKHLRALQARELAGGKGACSLPGDSGSGANLPSGALPAAGSPGGSNRKQSSVFGFSALKKMGFDPISGRDFVAPVPAAPPPPPVAVAEPQADDGMVHLDWSD